MELIIWIPYMLDLITTKTKSNANRLFLVLAIQIDFCVIGLIKNSLRAQTPNPDVSGIHY